MQLPTMIHLVHVFYARKRDCGFLGIGPGCVQRLFVDRENREGRVTGFVGDKIHGFFGIGKINIFL